MKKYLLPFLAILSCSCYPSREPIFTEETQNNADYTVDYLFEHDGCKVYRFYDKGEYIYFTNCNGETIRKTDSKSIRNSIRRY
jgi:hypothetical protein